MDQGKYFVYSYDSLTTNFGDAGQHFADSASSVQSILFYGKKQYRMPEFEEGIKYDIYGEPVGLGACLGVPEEELTCDLWGRKQPEAYRRYLLTCVRKPYQSIRQYSMCMKPMELNILEQIPGQDITLYDTSVHEGNGESAQESKIRYLEYGYGIINGRDLLRWGLQKMKQKFGKKR